MYYIYHIPGVKIGCSQNIKKRMTHQKFSHYEILEEHSDVYLASKREIELQKQYGYKVDNIPYYQSLKMITKAQEVSLKTKNEWLPKVDWKARDAKIDWDARKQKIINHPNYINRRKVNNSWKLRKTLLQYDLEGNFIKEWTCGTKNMPIEFKNAGGFAKQNKGTGYGFQWRYKTSEDYPKQIGKFENKMCQKVIQMDMNNNIIKIWDSQTIAAKYCGTSTYAISNCCRGKSKSSVGYKWKRYEMD